MVDLIQGYVPYCEECDWEGEFEEFESDARRAADKHEAECEYAKDSEEPPYQEVLDKLLDQVLGRD